MDLKKLVLELNELRVQADRALSHKSDEALPADYFQRSEAVQAEIQELQRREALPEKDRAITSFRYRSVEVQIRVNDHEYAHPDQPNYGLYFMINWSGTWKTTPYSECSGVVPITDDVRAAVQAGHWIVDTAVEQWGKSAPAMLTCLSKYTRERCEAACWAGFDIHDAMKLMLDLEQVRNESK